MSEPVVEIKNLVKSYRRGGQVVPVLTEHHVRYCRRRLRGADGAIRFGQEHAAQSDCGHRQTRQRILRVGGIDITSLGEADLAAWRADNVGFIFQFYNLMPVLTAFENVELPLLLTDLSSRERDEHVTAALAMVGLADRMEHFPSELSGGQQQRVAIARAIITDPTILVADEPTGDLDRVSAEEILNMMDQLNRELGKTIIMVTHDPHSAGKAHTVQHLDKGELRIED